MTGTRVRQSRRTARTLDEREEKIQAAIAVAMALKAAPAKSIPNRAAPSERSAPPKTAKKSTGRPKPSATHKPPAKKTSPEELKAQKLEAKKRKKLNALRERAKAAEAERRRNAAEERDALLKQQDFEKRQKVRSAVVEEFLSTIETRSFSDLLATWKKHATKTSGRNHASFSLSDRIVSAIEMEWDRRRHYAKPTDYFDWPTTEIGIDRGGGLSSSEWVREGLLHCMGYHVGKGSPLSSEGRYRLLARIYEGYLPPVNGPNYMSQWGRPCSAERLEKLAQSLASFARQAKRRSSANLEEAIRSWESDLRFLHDQYYAPKFLFRWPSH